jgi:hypothetical protein
MSEVIRSKHGQAVLISLRNDPDASRGQNAPVERFEWRRPLRQRNGENVGRERDASSLSFGALAQLGEHLLCKQRVIGSIPIGSTKIIAGPVPGRFVQTGSVAQVVRAHA